MKTIPFIFFFILILGCGGDKDTITTTTPVKFSLSITVNPDKSGVVEPSKGTYDKGDKISITATAADLYEFDNWTGKLNDTQNPLSVTMDSDIVLVANFKLKDTDNDGVTDDIDRCPNTPSGETVNANGCSATELNEDSDNDGVINDDDSCPNTPAGETVDSNGCSDSQLDTDNDGVTNNNDNCPNTPTGETVDNNGCSDSQKHSVSILSVTDIGTDSAKVSGNANSGQLNIVAYGHCWSDTNSSPQVSTNNSSNLGTLSGTKTFESTLTGLKNGTLYYVRSYIKDNSGNYYYSNDIKTFTTLTNASISIEVEADVTFNGNVNNLGSGISDRGFLWSTNVNPPTINNFGNGDKINLGPQPTLGAFSKKVSVNTLQIGVPIYARSYVTYSDGTISYSGVKSFTIDSNWSQIASLPEVRTGSVAFAINNTGYLTTGWDGTSYGSNIGTYRPPIYSNTLFAYSPSSNSWTDTSSDYNLTPRASGTAFVVNDIAYVGTGRVSGNGRKKDFSSYSSNTWTSIASISSDRVQLVSFVINGTAYTGSGSDDVRPKDNFYAYTPSSNTWRSISSLPITTKLAFGFALNNKGYVGTGIIDNISQERTNKIYRYEPNTDSWTALNNFPTTLSNAFTFVVDGKAYVGGGYNGTAITNKFYQYDETNDEWIEVENVPVGFKSARTFVIGSKGYVGSGETASAVSTDLFYSFTPPAKKVY